MSVGQNIKRLCDKLGITGKELAQLSKVPASTIYSILGDKADPTASNLKKIVITLGVTADMVLFDEEETNNEELTYIDNKGNNDDLNDTGYGDSRLNI